MIKFVLLLLFLPSAFVAWLEHRAFMRLAAWYYRLAWVPLAIDGELPKLDPERFMRHAAEEPALGSLQ